VGNLPFGKDHSDEYARRCIFYFDCYLNKKHDFKNTHYPAMPDDMGYYACLLIGEAYEWLGEYDKMLFYLRAAGKFNGSRNEHFVKLAQYYRRIEQWGNMLEVTSILTMEGRINPFPQFSFFIENSAYQDTGTLCNELHEIALSNV